MVSSLSVSFAEQAQRIRQRIDAGLLHYTNFPAGCPEKLSEAIRYSLLAPGKRLRPTLVMLAAETCGGDAGAALPAACAVEMVHAYSLIHDDLPAMDDDDLRRGRSSCHKVYGEATAILAGDALLALAFEVLAKEVQPPDVAAVCCAALAEAAGASALVGGQADDLAADSVASILNTLESIHERKTGAIIRVSLRLGGLVASADRHQLAALERYGQRVGLAFQIVDDLLDVQGTEEKMGKRTGKDHEQGKLTFPGLLGAAESQRRAAQLVDEACHELKLFGQRGDGLEALARYVLERNH